VKINELLAARYPCIVYPGARRMMLIHIYLPRLALPSPFPARGIIERYRCSSVFVGINSIPDGETRNIADSAPIPPADRHLSHE
jgi:hypothetical protein